jgi:hypothetical protein
MKNSTMTPEQKEHWAKGHCIKREKNSNFIEETNEDGSVWLLEEFHKGGYELIQQVK